VAGLLLGASIFSMFFLLSLYMQQVLGYSPLKAGFSYLLIAGTIIFAAGASQAIVTRLGVRRILVYAGNPYTVTDRPNWFAESLFSAIAQLCQAKQIDVTLTNAGGNPCPPPASPSAKPTATATH